MTVVPAKERITCRDADGGIPWDRLPPVYYAIFRGY
jgi:hypothetical protein